MKIVLAPIFYKLRTLVAFFVNENNRGEPTALVEQLLVANKLAKTSEDVFGSPIFSERKSRIDGRLVIQ